MSEPYPQILAARKRPPPLPGKTDVRKANISLLTWLRSKSGYPKTNRLPLG